MDADLMEAENRILSMSEDEISTAIYEDRVRAGCDPDAVKAMLVKDKLNHRLYKVGLWILLYSKERVQRHIAPELFE